MKRGHRDCANCWNYSCTYYISHYITPFRQKGESILVFFCAFYLQAANYLKSVSNLGCAGRAVWRPTLALIPVRQARFGGSWGRVRCESPALSLSLIEESPYGLIGWGSRLEKEIERESRLAKPRAPHHWHSQISSIKEARLSDLSSLPGPLTLPLCNLPACLFQGLKSINAGIIWWIPPFSTAKWLGCPCVKPI